MFFSKDIIIKKQGIRLVVGKTVLLYNDVSNFYLFLYVSESEIGSISLIAKIYICMLS